MAEDTNVTNQQGNNGQGNNPGPGNPDPTPQQKQGLWKAIQNYLNKSGFTSQSEITTVDDNVLQTDQASKTDPFLNPTVATFNNAALWRTADDMEREQETTGMMARDSRYRDYRQMIREPELEAAIHIYADEATQSNEEGHIVEIFSENSKIKDMLERLLYNKLNIDRYIWDVVFETGWMGDSFYEMLLDKETQREILKLHRLRPEDCERKERDGKLEKFMVFGKEIEPFRIVHFRNKSIRFGNYGASIYESGRQTWRQLKLMEDAVIIYRVTRSPERKVFYVDVGRNPADKAETIVERFKQRFQKKKSVNITTGRIDSTTNVLSWNENYYIPRVEGRQGSEITTLEGIRGQGDIDDLAYFKDKLMAMLRIPRDYISYSAGSMQNQTSGRYLSEQDVRFSRIIGRLQQNIIDGLKKICVLYLALNGVGPEEVEQFELTLTKPSAIEELRRIEVQTQQFALIQAIKGLEMFPDVWILSKIMQLDDDEIAEIVHLMKIQRASMMQDQAAAAGGGGGMPGGGGPMPGGDMGGPPGGGGGAIPPEVDGALAGTPGAAQGGAAQGGNEGPVAAMLNAMENTAKEYEDNMAKNEYDTVKRRTLKDRIRAKLNAMREDIAAGKQVDMVAELHKVGADMEVLDVNSSVRVRETAKKLKEVLNGSNRRGPFKLEEQQVVEELDPNDIYNKKWYRALLNEDVEIIVRRRTKGEKTMIENIEAYFSRKDKRKQGRNNYLRELLMEGEIKGNKINPVQLLREKMDEQTDGQMRGLLNEERFQRYTRKKIKSKKRDDTPQS